VTTRERKLNRWTEQNIAAAIEGPRALGPGLLESVYESALTVELRLRGIPFERQRPVSVLYKSEPAGEYRIDFVVADTVIVETKAVKSIEPVHEAQRLSFLRLTKCTVRLLINLNTIRLVDGVRRMRL